MTKAELIKLNRILGMLGSDHDGERAAAGIAATNFLKARNLSWWTVIGGDRRAAAPAPGKGEMAMRSYEIGIDHGRAAQSRVRQLQADRDALELENKRLRARLAAMAEQERRARYDE
jgi:hypothetical protein